jgi:hypothetical protein
MSAVAFQPDFAPLLDRYARLFRIDVTTLRYVDFHLGGITFSLGFLGEGL